MIAGVLIGLSGRVLAEFPSVVEWHRAVFFPRIAAVLQSLSRGVATTIGEVLWVVVGLSGVVALVRFGSRAVAPLVLSTGLLVAGFYASWGLAYHYQPLGFRFASLEKGESAPTDDAALLDLARRSGALLTRADGTAPEWSGEDAAVLATINAGLTQGFAELPASIEASPIRGIDFGPAKLSRISYFLSRFQVSGYFSPWTGEAQIDAEMPRSLWARVAAHEKAHQRGFARENEATVIGLLACLSSSDPRVFYGGSIGLFVGLDREVARVDPEVRKEIWKGLPARVIDQLQHEAAFWKSHDGAAAHVSEKVNDTYLKAQGVRSGVGSYAETTRLIMQAAATPTLNLGSLLRLDEAAPVAK